MLEYEIIRKNRRKFLALTGLTVKEFQELLRAFATAYERRQQDARTSLGSPRQRQAGGGRMGRLHSTAQKLLFILVYQKTYPLQVVLGELFDLSQPSANEWIHRLLPVLQDALTVLGVMPVRDGADFAKRERQHAESADYIIDGTERRRQRPKQAEKQAQHYSGKKKAHSDKNLIIVHRRSKRVGYLSPTYAGKTHDKKLADCERIRYPRATTLHKDTGFQGYEPNVADSRQPKKSRVAKS